MPLRDHFHPPLDRVLSWVELHGQWPAVIVQQLRKRLPPGYAVGHVFTQVRRSMRLQTWSHALALGQPLPTLPVWSSQNLSVPFDLEQSYEQACADLAII